MTNRIAVVGLGPAGLDRVPGRILEWLEDPEGTVVVRTARHPAAMELAEHGIRVNCVAPSAIDGETVRDTLPPETIGMLEAAVPLGRLCAPADVGGAVALLASELAAYVTGQTLMLDGGLSCTTQRPPIPAA